MKIDSEDTHIMECWDTGLFTLEMLAMEYGVTRSAVKYFLNKRGVDTSKRQLVMLCEICGIEFRKTRARVRRCNKHYCSSECYMKAIHNPGYQIHRQGQRIARRVIGEVFKLESGMVVHHIDGDNRNNGLLNLMVFANHGDHMRYHRGTDVIIPLFRVT